IKLDNINIRLSSVKTLGHLSEYHDEVLTILNEEFSNCKSDTERFEFLLAMLKLEGLESSIREDIEILLEFLPNNVKSQKQIDYHFTIKDLELKIKREKEEKRIDEKWYSKKEFLPVFIQNLITFKADEKGFELQEIYSEFIRLILTSLFLNSISVESMINFPKRGNLPDEIADIIEEDYRKSTRKEKAAEEERLGSNYSSIFKYTRLIQYLALFNLDFVINKINKKEYYKFEETEFKDILSNYAIEELITPGKPIKHIRIHDKEFWESKGKEILEFWKKQFKFDHYLYQQCLVSIIAYFESFLYGLVSYLEKNKFITYQYNKEIFINLQEFEKKSFHSKFQYLKDFGLIDPKWTYKNQVFKLISQAIDTRNRIVHKNIVEKTDYIDFSISYIEEIVTSIAKYSNELYNNTAKRIKTSL
ncbi:MAG: hypothetical protein ACFFDW_13845, partial [Candidatus Thorarchaeota archaeon]